MREATLGALVLATALAGCIAQPSPLDVAPAAAGLLEPVWDTTGNFSRTLATLGLPVLPVEWHNVTSFDGTPIASTAWRPDVPAGTQVPVILTLSPYFGDALALDNLWTREFFFESFVSNGYAYGHVAVRGTSFSGGCMEWWGPNERLDFGPLLDYYGAQPWSNGKVALIGISYDGATPWMAASLGNPYLAAIVPIAGHLDVYDLHFRNGTIAEATSSPVEHLSYWTFSGELGRAEPTRMPEGACEELAKGQLVGAYTSATGSRATPSPAETYWADRDWREAVRANYQGAVYLVHGLEDTVTDPWASFPFVSELQREGRDVRMMLGQWGHSFPDLAFREVHLRWDWAEKLLRWFDVHLRGEARDLGPRVDVEDTRGLWRTEEQWPPADAADLVLHLGDGTLTAEPAGAGSSRAYNPGGALDSVRASGGPRAPLSEWRFSTGRLSEELRFVGQPKVHVTVVPAPYGGQLYAELLDVAHGGQEQRVARGVMDLRYHAGGYEPQDLRPGEPVLALMELSVSDAVIAPGHELVLRIVPDSRYRGGLEPGPGPTMVPLELQWGEGMSVLRLDTVARDVGDGRYPGQPTVG